ncbi:MAG: hypothetical protein ACOCVF_02545 [bacterium]
MNVRQLIEELEELDDTLTIVGISSSSLTQGTISDVIDLKKTKLTKTQHEFLDIYENKKIKKNIYVTDKVRNINDKRKDVLIIKFE